ncbi:hypothetical protein AAHE18_U032000 [Arachis hypogaea]
MWAATWLYMATRKPAYLKYIQEELISASVTEFNWDLKYAGAQILLTKLKMGICNQDAVKQLQSMMENEHASKNEIDNVLSSYVALKIQKSAAQFVQAALHEIDVLSYIAKGDPSIGT